MSTRTCESCLGTGEKPSLGHMPPYKCTKCAGTGKIHNFNDFGKAPENLVEEVKETVPEKQAENAPRRGRPPKSNNW